MFKIKLLLMNPGRDASFSDEMKIGVPFFFFFKNGEFVLLASFSV